MTHARPTSVSVANSNKFSPKAIEEKLEVKKTDKKVRKKVAPDATVIKTPPAAARKIEPSKLELLRGSAKAASTRLPINIAAPK